MKPGRNALDSGPDNALDINAVMLPEPGIFNRNKRILQMYRDFIQRHIDPV